MDAARFAELLHRIDHAQWGQQERALVAQAVALAVESGDEELEYQARMRQTASANMAGDTDLTLSSFAWCLAKHDADPVRFPADLGHGVDLMWHFKWMAGTLRASTRFSLEQIDAVLNDMAEHYRRAGLGPSGVLMARFESAWATGRFTEAEALRIELERTPRDAHSHCEACTRSQVAAYFTETNRDADAIRLVGEMLDNDLACAEEPEHALTRVLIPYLRAGRFDDAKYAHMRAYRLAMDDPDSLGIVAGNVIFAAITGNEARALAMLERHMRWLGHDGLNDAAHFRALAAFALALDAITATGHGDTPIRGSEAPSLHRFFGETSEPLPAQDLAALAWAAAQRLADAFDARNGNTTYTESLNATRALATEHYDVPVRSESFSASVPLASTADTPDARMQRALALADWGDAPGALAAARLARADGDPQHEARLLAIIIAASVALDDLATAEAELPVRLAALQRDGDVVQAATEQRLGLAAFGRLEQADMELLEEVASTPDLPDATMGELYLALSTVGITINDAPAATQLAADAVDAFLRAGLDDRAASAMTFHASVLFRTGQDGVAVAERALNLPGATEGTRGAAMHLLARQAGIANDPAAGIAYADGASRIGAALGAMSGLADVYILSAMLHEDAGDHMGAAHRFRVAAQAAEREGHANALMVRYRLGIALTNAGDPGAAADVLRDVLALEGAAEIEDSSRAETAAALARACEADDNPLEAAEVWEYAAFLYGQGNSASYEGQALTHAARVRGSIGEYDMSMTLLQRAADIGRANPDDPALLLLAVHLQAQAALAQGVDATAYLEEAERIARETGDEWGIADIADTRARDYAARGQTDRAVATALQAADAFAAAGDLASAGTSEQFAARVLFSADRLADSVPLFRAALEHADPGRERQVAALELGEVLERLGRHAEAAEARVIAESDPLS